MEILEKARILAGGGRYDSCGPKACEIKIDSGLGGIYNAKAENANCKMFKTLMSNSCSFDCKYCQNSRCKNKTSYEPEELARLFNHLNKKLDINGLFLSSAINHDADKMTEKMLEAVRLVRFKYRFRGYVHFKILPGTSYELVKQASELADRMSINIEAPNKSILSELSSCKNFHNDILKRQAWISKLSKSQTTQVIVSNIASDKEILKMARWEYEKLGLKRIYFSAFKPVKGTEMENEKPVPSSRENHLYNIDFLVRKYGFEFREIEKILKEGMLPNCDPKMAMAQTDFSGPIDIKSASYEQLIRVPGIGIKTAKKLVAVKVGNRAQLRELGVLKRAEPFIQINGARQKMLFEF